MRVIPICKNCGYRYKVFGNKDNYFVNKCNKCNKRISDAYVRKVLKNFRLQK